jgi:hypothetical protein
VPVATFIGLKDLNATVPGWCEAVRTDPMVAVPIGTSTSAGTATMSIDNIAYDANLIGLPLFSQAFAPLPGNLALTNGVRFSAGTDPAYPKVGRVYSYLVGTGTTSSGPWTGGIITLFQ